MSTDDVVVIGGGQAGLAAGHFLARQGRRFVILEAADGPAAAWRGRWDSLRLFTPARFDALPGRPFPGDPDRYPTRDEVADYLADYARDLPVEYGARVTRLAPAPAGYRIELADRVLEAAQVVIATGPFQAPRTPALAAALGDGVLQLHSSDYRNPAQIPAGPVLVVGGGNTGYQIAEELIATHAVHLSVGSRQIPLPQRVLGVDLFRILTRTGAMRKTVHSRIGRRMKDRETLIGSSPRGARRRGIRLHGRTTAADGAAAHPRFGA
jgi:putative flavoprotein involved in K+ transport